MTFRVPFIDPREHYAKLKSEIDRAITNCLANGDLVNRQQLRDFEHHLTEFVGVKYAIGVNSGYHALYFALLGAGVGPGHEVITVAHTFVATVSAIVHCGAQPVLIDVGPDFNMNVELIEPAITSRTKALLPVHLNGRLCDMEKILTLADKYGLAVIEDAAQALGATFDGICAGSQGRAGCFSFYPFKVLGGFGDGGAITTNDPQLARMATLLRYNGEDRETGEYHYHGQTALLDNVQAAVLDVKLRYLPEWIAHRRRIADLYRRGLSGITPLRVPHFDETRRNDIYQNYVVRTTLRDQLRAYLKEQGIETLVHWPKPMWEHRGLGLAAPDLPETSSLCREVLSLPMSAETMDDQVATIVSCIQTFFAKNQ
ncbi:MAG: Aminotransferase, DegT/DnrJ/EryC1/StrS family [Nitrospira sp.]|jgi:dTDP-4-amino-4,6-dideoxygalactose transaminase|nr:MAG: Aminotransferase, DegT/DnrJ/EryC1/StrS family [Nitrospira sp.]